MRLNFLSFILISFLFACNSEEETNLPEIESTVKNVKEEGNVVEENNVISPGEHVEYHENGSVKIKGRYDENGQRAGLWTSYYDNGVKWSESYYVGGIIDGHSFTFYPNGEVRYRGEYDMGEKIGTWIFYDEAGNITKEEKY